MTRQLTRPQAVQLGGIVLIGVALAAWLLWSLDQRRGLGGGSLVVEVGFADIAGVEVGTRIRLQGIDAGEVVAVLPPQQPGAQVKLRMRLNGKLRHLVTADSHVQIGSDGLFSGRIIRLLPGSVASGLATDGACLAAAPSVEITENVSDVLSKVNVAMDDVRVIVTKAYSAMDDIDKGKGNLGMLLKDGSLYTDLAKSTAKLSDVLTKVNNAMDNLEKGKGTLGMLLKDGTLYNDLNSTLADVKSALNEVRNGDGTLGKLMKNNEAYSEAVQSLQDVRRMVASVKQNADAIKSLPVVRSYVVDVHKELVRPDCQRFCHWLPESDLFEPGRAVLTTEGKKKLDDAAAWVNGHKEVGAEVVIAAFARLGQDPDVALTLTQKQSEAVCEYLKKTHHIQSTGWWWWSTRTVRAIGAGTNPPALPGSEKLPQARIELLVFVPGS